MASVKNSFNNKHIMSDETETPILHEPHGDAHPVRSALSAGTKKKDRKNRALTWDEHAIEEHDQLRGTRMKVRLIQRQNRNVEF